MIFPKLETVFPRCWDNFQTVTNIVVIHSTVPDEHQYKVENRFLVEGAVILLSIGEPY